MKGQRCTLQEALGGVERCAGDDCSFWETGREDGCVIAPIRLQLLERPALARHLLDLRLALDRAVPGQEQDESRRLFYRLLNEEQAAE